LQIRQIKITKKNLFIRKIKNIESRAVRSIPLRIKELNRFFNNKNYDNAKKEARKILNWIYDDEEYEKYSKNALRVLLQILSSEKDYERVILTFEDYKIIGYKDPNCVDIYKKAQKEKELKEK